MTKIGISGLLLVLCLTGAGAQEKLLTTDPLTGLPVSPATDPGFQLATRRPGCPTRRFARARCRRTFTACSTRKWTPRSRGTARTFPASRRSWLREQPFPGLLLQRGSHGRRVDHGAAGRRRKEHRWLFRVLSPLSATAFRKSDGFDGDGKGRLPVMFSSICRIQPGMPAGSPWRQIS